MRDEHVQPHVELEPFDKHRVRHVPGATRSTTRCNAHGNSERHQHRHVPGVRALPRVSEPAMRVPLTKYPSQAKPALLWEVS
jgi:hypothetical protein